MKNPILSQDERDDWWTARIDPYDDRIRELERFRHRMEAAPSWTPPAPTAGFNMPGAYSNAPAPGTERYVTLQAASVEADRVALAAAESDIKRLTDENKTLTETNLRFAGLITEQRARLKAVEHCITTPIQQHQPGEQNGSNQTVRELQQGNPLQASANGGAHLLP